jgi:hypothetical protein
MAATGRQKPHYLAITAIFWNEAPYLAEWIAFHRNQGVDHFFLYDNRSSDDYLSVLTPWIDAGIATVVRWDLDFAKRAQSLAYADCLERFGPQARWIAFIDLDEFLFAPDGSPLPVVLADYEEYPGIVVNWQVYGSSGLARKPAGLMIESFVRRAPTQWVRNRRVKSIVDPERAKAPLGVHFFAYRDGGLAVSETHASVQPRRSPQWRRHLERLLANAARLAFDPYAIWKSSQRRVSVRRLRINHYVTKSREEFDRRPRANPDRDAYFAFHDRNDVDDPILVAHAEQVRALLGGPISREEPAPIAPTARP